MKVKRSIVITMLLAIIVSVTLIGLVFAQGKKIIYTTLDIKQEYEIISIITGYAQVPTAVFKDPFLKAHKAAWKDFMKTAAAAKADAVVGVRMDFENITKDMVGRLIIYGTAVKFSGK